MLDIASLSYKTFANFVTGQCCEAVILGTMFFISMSILRFPSTCCNTRNRITKAIAFIGSATKIRKVPKKHPIKAPKIGINAVNAIKTPTKSA